MSSQEGAAPPPQGVVPNFEKPEDVLHTINLVSQILSITSVTIFMLMRIYAKAFIAPPFHMDDWVAFVAWILSLGYSATALVMHHYGGGFHVYEITKADFIGFLKVRIDAFKTTATLTSPTGLYADSLVYGPNSYFTKLALLLIVIRVFRLHRRTILGTYAVILFMSGYYLPVFVIKAMICRPIAGFWDSSVPADCFNQRAIFVADTAVSAVTDLAVLCIPIPVTLTLRMSWTRRLKVMAMLSAGGIATAASIVRMILVIGLQHSNDEAVDFIRFNLLGTAEVSIGMICACLPAVNIILMRGFDCSRDSSNNSNSFFATIELKFLKGSKLQTHHLTEAEREPAVFSRPIEENGQLRTDKSFIFPIERLNKPQPTMQRDVERGESLDEWQLKLTMSPFSEPDSPDWARRATLTLDEAQDCGSNSATTKHP
ncbi:hypothetical protein CCHL11_00077 [Colletotrichum chlorophyti]|uniref:Rhodopsin domain-containing protein n=1 Tax=Colletotrichum chlorophyti TaxID=708187 RepID=A0A1Q8RV29_9PEZI|nr:hypothetical protein CCHL11_00077 [Colletotrichum chlorophyti]